LTGCTTKQPEPEINVIEKITYKTISIPEEYFVCNIPDINASNIRTQGDVARLIVDIDEALNKCKANISAAYKEYKKQVEK
jgi:hypothetical protein